jgi:uncharacterized lipoprotein YajG
MWIFLSDSFLSIVHKDCRPNQLLVRARRQGDIERVFPRAKVRESHTTDYRYRAVVSREQVAKALTKQAMEMAYDNFKDSVADNELHNAYSRVWSVMYGMQAPRRRRYDDELFPNHANL